MSYPHNYAPPNQYGMHAPPGQPPPPYSHVPSPGSIHSNIPSSHNFGPPMPPQPYHVGQAMPHLPQHMDQSMPHLPQHMGPAMPYLPQHNMGHSIPQPQHHMGQPIPHPSVGVPHVPLPGYPHQGHLPPPGMPLPYDSHHQKKLKKKELKRMMKLGIPIAGATAVGAYGVSKLHKKKHKSKNKGSSSSSSDSD